MKISSRSKYGLRAMIYLARQKDICSIKEIAIAEEIPEDYLEKICSTLHKAGLLKVKKGTKGGFYLAKKATDISLAAIMGALENNHYALSCLENLPKNYQHQSV